METLNLNVNLENLTNEEREALMKLVEKSQEKKSRVWKPSDCELYWSMDSSLVFNSRWYDCEIDKERYECGNCFRTREEAEEELTRRQMLTKWKRLSIEAGEDENKWKHRENGWPKHWYVFFDEFEKVINCGANDGYHSESTYFPSKQSLLAAISELGEENVKKYILGIK